MPLCNVKYLKIKYALRFGRAKSKCEAQRMGQRQTGKIVA